MRRHGQRPNADASDGLLNLLRLTVEDDDDEQGDKFVTDGQGQPDDDRMKDHSKLQHSDSDQLSHSLARADIIIHPGYITRSITARIIPSLGHLLLLPSRRALLGTSNGGDPSASLGRMFVIMPMGGFGIRVGVVGDPEFFHLLVTDSEGGDFGKEDGVDGDHGDRRCPVLVGEVKRR